MSKIDFVITWVDGSDPQWIAQKNQYDVTRVESSSLEANSTCRYRCDAELLRYWFRSVEAFAPWVNAIFFITCGQKPEWLNENHPKLRIVNHEDYIPERYLPTFNSNTIELNVHRIAELSEQFVLFNDDMFLLRPVGPDFFYNHGNPVLATDLRYPRAVGYNNWSRLLFNDYCVLQRSFNVRKSIWGNRNKWFSPCKLGIKRSRQNFICYLANKTIPVGIYGHLIQPHLKSTLEAIWSMHPDVLSSHPGLTPYVVQLLASASNRRGQGNEGRRQGRK